MKKDIKQNNIEKVLNMTDEKLLAKALQQYLKLDKKDIKKGTKNEN
ncbi:hypothetical protein [[Clostridium] colinum]|nr:hypothetical protein [[Clostridium] colinum]